MGIISENTPVRKECFGDFQKDIHAVRKCGVCMDFEECKEETDIRKSFEVDLSTAVHGVESKAVKLDNGKRKYSLIIPSMMDMLLPALTKDHLYYWLREAIMELSRAAPSTNQGDLVMRCCRATCCIQKYVSGSHLEYYSIRALDELTLAMEYGANKPEYGRNNWK